MLKPVLLAVAVAMLFSWSVGPQAAFAQQAVKASCSGNAICVKDELEKHGVAMTPSELRNALNGEDADIRALAASALEEIKDPEAGSLIRSAMERENDPRTRISMANYLLNIGDRSGVSVLESMCKSNDNDGALRSSSAQVLLGYHIESQKCFAGVEEMVRSTEHPEMRAEGIFVLGKYRNLPAESLRELRELQLSLLSDPDRFVRTRAVESLAMSGDFSVLPILMHLEVKETDDKEMDDLERHTISAAIARLKNEHSAN
jgi:hypothetical protein